MKSNSGTKTTLTGILVVVVVFLAIGVMTSISKENLVVDSNVISVATVEKAENTQYVETRNVRHSITDNAVSSRSMVSSRFEEEVIEQIEEDEEKARKEA